MSDISEAVERVLKLSAEATPGPWEWHTEHGRDITGEGYSCTDVNFDGHSGAALTGDDERWDADAAFIAHVRTDAETLARYIQKVKPVVEAARLALTDETHLLRAKDTGWELAHPLRCRDDMLRCGVHRVIDEDARLNDLTTYAPEFGNYVVWIAHGVLEAQPAAPDRKDAVESLRAALSALDEARDA